MASFVYTPAKAAFLNGTLDLDAHDIRLLLVMTNTTADTQEDAAVLADFTTLDEYDHGSYARVTLAGEAVTADTTNNRGEFDHNDFSWTALGAGTRQAQAAVYYRHVDGTAANDIPIFYVDTGGFPFAGNGGNVNWTVNAEGALWLS